MNLPVPPVLLITDRLLIINGAQVRRDLVEIVEAALAGGIRWVSLREKDLSSAERRALLARLQPIAARHGAKLMVHGDVEAAVALGLDGVHLGHGGDIAVARARLGPNCLIGASAHNATEIAAAHASGANYVTLSPIFLTASKPGYGPALGLAGLAHLCAESALPVLALGGIDAENAGDCQQSGAAGIAVMGGVMRAEDPAEIARGIISAVSPLKE